MLGLASFLAILFGAVVVIEVLGDDTPKNIKHRSAKFFTGLLMTVLGIYGLGEALDIRRAEHKERLVKISKNGALKTRYLQCVDTLTSSPVDCSKEVFKIYSKYEEEVKMLENLENREEK